MLAQSIRESYEIDRLSPRAFHFMFLDLTTFYHDLLKEFGIDVECPTHNVEAAYKALPLDRQKSVLRDLSISLKALEESISCGDLPRFSDLLSLTRAQEVTLIRKVLNARGLECADPLFFHHIDEGDIIEVYDYRGIQIARSWSYFRYCRYSLADLLVYDWNTLYIRPTQVIEKLISVATDLFRRDAATISYDIPEYLVVERFSKRRRGTLYQMKFGSPIRDLKTGETVALISTGRLSQVADVKLGINLRLL